MSSMFAACAICCRMFSRYSASVIKSDAGPQVNLHFVYFHYDELAGHVSWATSLKPIVGVPSERPSTVYTVANVCRQGRPRRTRSLHHRTQTSSNTVYRLYPSMAACTGPLKMASTRGDGNACQGRASC